jgi:hypothetical protein
LSVPRERTVRRWINGLRVQTFQKLDIEIKSVSVALTSGRLD